MAETKVITNPSFHLKAGVHERDDPAYLEYRRRWREDPQRDVLSSFPIHLDIESTSACNLRCPMCFQTKEETRPDYGMMPMDLYRRILDEGSEKGLCSIKLQYRGEPMMNDDLEEMVAYAKSKGVIEVMFNTNATLLTEDRARRLIEAGLDKIICSIDGHTPEVYNPIRVFPNRDGDFDLILRNIRGLRRLRDELGSPTPLIRVQMVDMPDNHAYVREYTEFWMQNGADAVAVEEHLDYFSEFVELSRSREEASRKLRIYPEFRCEQLWQRLFVLYSGKVTMCCGDHYQHHPLGLLLTDERRSQYLQRLEKAIAKGSAIERDGLLEAKLTQKSSEISAIVGTKAEDGSLKIVGVRDAYDQLIPEMKSIESIWRGVELSRVRNHHRAGTSHEVPVCGSCSLRTAAQRASEREDAA